MRKSKLKYLFAGAALATVLAVTAAVSPALAYFTAFTSASGGRTISVEPPDTKLNEDPEGSTKTIWITNTGGSPCFVRVKILYPEGVVSSSVSTESGEEWIYEDDGYYHYNSVLKSDSDTSKLKIDFTIKNEGADFNVIVVEEYIPAVWNEAEEKYEPYGNWSPISQDSSEGEEVEAE